jgi:hypothetical protein
VPGSVKTEKVTYYPSSVSIDGVSVDETIKIGNKTYVSTESVAKALDKDSIIDKKGNISIVKKSPQKANSNVSTTPKLKDFKEVLKGKYKTDAIFLAVIKNASLTETTKINQKAREVWISTYESNVVSGANGISNSSVAIQTAISKANKAASSVK